MNKVYVIGMGPGAYEQMTVKAVRTLEKCDVIVGYTVYILSLIHILNCNQRAIRKPYGIKKQIHKEENAMNVICNRNCVDAVGGKCVRKELEIGKTGLCQNFVEFREFYREDNVVVMDKNGLPSIMVKLTRKQDVKPIHPMFIIGGEVFDEIFISKYKNCIINGLAYSLPMQKRCV